MTRGKKGASEVKGGENALAQCGLASVVPAFPSQPRSDESGVAIGATPEGKQQLVTKVIIGISGFKKTHPCICLTGCGCSASIADRCGWL